MTSITTPSDLSILPDLVWLDGLAVIDLDASGCGSFFTSAVQCGPCVVNAFAGQIGDPDDIAIVVNVVGVDASACAVHSKNLRSNSFSQNEVATEFIHESGNFFQ